MCRNITLSHWLPNRPVDPRECFACDSRPTHAEDKRGPCNNVVVAMLTHIAIGGSPLISARSEAACDASTRSSDHGTSTRSVESMHELAFPFGLFEHPCANESGLRTLKRQETSSECLIHRIAGPSAYCSGRTGFSYPGGQAPRESWSNGFLERGIGTAIHHPLLISQRPSYAKCGF
jgi:hypothetical protein